jgi:hypothetical protein
MNSLLVEEEQADVSKHRACGDDVWVSASGRILTEAGIFSPVVADLAARPVVSYNLESLAQDCSEGIYVELPE